MDFKQAEKIVDDQIAAGVKQIKEGGFEEQEAHTIFHTIVLNRLFKTMVKETIDLETV